jgi:hypothetical protein
MSRRLLLVTATMLSIFSAIASAADVKEHRSKGKEAPGPCKEIAEACKQAGFVQGDWKKGDGLWRDCVDPIIQGKTNVPGATKPLPTVDPKTVAACKAKHPKYGEGKVGSEKKK